jgi:hypothetical protein
MNLMTNSLTACSRLVRVRSGRAVLLALAISGAGAAGVLPGTTLIAPAAYAGQWVQVSCANPDQSAASSEGWSSFISGTPGYGSNNGTTCAPGSPMFAILSTAAAAPVGTGENLQYAPPGGSTLAGGSIDVGLFADGFGYGASGTAVVYTPAFAYDGSDVVFQCANGLGPCSNGTNDFSGTLSLPANRGGDLYLAAGCGGIPGQACNAGGSNAAWSLVQLWWADLLLTNTSAPAGSGLSGSLLAPDAHGTADIAFTATDPNGPGVYKVTVEIDGTAVYNATPNTNQGKCAAVGSDNATGALMFDWQQPCPQTETVDIPISTAGLADGQHDLKLIVTDAAQNSSTVLDQTITTLNRTTVSALLNSPPPAPAPTSTPPVYSIALDAATKRLTSGVRRSYDRSAVRLGGLLETASGVAAPGVPVALWARPASGGDFRRLARTTTDGTGAWALTAPRGPSRLLRVVAGTHARAASAASSASVRETVTPMLTLHVATPGGGRIMFTGQLAIAPLGQPRPLVFIQTRGPHGWQVVGSPVRVAPNGRFHYVYRSSPLTLGRRFSFRATTPQTALWQPAHSTVQTAAVH